MKGANNFQTRSTKNTSENQKAVFTTGFDNSRPSITRRKSKHK